MTAMRGFTLIELVACLLILAVLAALGGPLLFETQPFDERGYADELTAALRYAQNVAVASQCNVSVTVTVTGYSALQQPPGPGNTCAPAGAYTQGVLRSDGTLLAGTPPSDATVSSGATVIFGSSGQVINGTPPALGIGPYTLSIDPNSGFVSVQ
jgi:MSHA pilin protein MshC